MKNVFGSFNKNTYMNPDAIVTTGVGTHQMMAAQFIKWTQYNKMISSGSLGVMGVGVHPRRG